MEIFFLKSLSGLCAGDMKTCLQNTFSKSIFNIMFCWYLDLADYSSNHFPDCVLETRRLAYKNLFPKVSSKYFLLISRFGRLFLKSLSWLCAGDMWSIPTTEFHSPLIIAVKRPLMNVRQNCKYRKGNQRKPVLLI